MAFTTPSLFIAGLVAAAIPIAIHLLSKGKPKKVVFAALRFTQATLAANRRRFRLRRFLLLALRVALLTTLGLALARPIFIAQLPPSSSSVADEESPEDSAASGRAGKDAPVATAIVLDSSLRMGRVKGNATLFDRAKATAQRILSQAPRGSELAVLDGTTSGDGFQSDRYAARTRLNKMTVTPGGRTAAESTLAALSLVRSSKLARREIYVLTDMTTVGWSDRDMRRLRRAAGLDNQSATDDSLPTFYFLDLGDDDWRNVSILSVAPSAETISKGSALRVDLELERVDPAAGDVALEALFFNADDLPNAATPEELAANESLAFRREKQTLSFGPGRVRNTAVFNVSDLPAGECVGLARILGKDALAADDARTFVVNVVPDWRLLVAAPQPIEEKALFLTQALAPEEFRLTGRAPFELDVVPYDAQNGRALATLSDDALSQYRAIFLLDPPGLAPETIARLASYASDGGGIGVFLGRGANPLAAFQTPEALKLLGHKPTRQETSSGLAIAPTSYDEPLLAAFRPFQRAGIPWDAAPITRYWKLEELTDAATVVARFESAFGPIDETAPPAIVETRVGRGLVATIATPISDGAQERPWNALTSGDAVWIFVVLADGMARRLASASSSIRNYATGEDATLRTDLREFPAIATIYTPSGEEIETPTDVERRQIRFPGVKEPGICRVKTAPNRSGDSVDQVFSVATPGEESDMTRRSSEDWARLWEGFPYKELDVDASVEDLDARDDNDSEPYALIVALLAAIFILETFVANRFYEDSSAASKNKEPHVAT
ncbi:MAG: BatA domain-containing protein [Thermoguttaceae bacterium]|jgi:hypothetical protein